MKKDGYSVGDGYMGKIGAVYILFKNEEEYDKAWKEYWGL